MLPFAIHPPLPQIRLWRDEDAEAVARFWREAYTVWPGGGVGGGLLDAEGMRRDTERNRPFALYLYWAPDEANGGERVVGYCSMYHLREPDAAYVGTLGAHPGAFRTGVGRDLLKVALAKTVELGRKRLELHTWPGNERAVPLYKKTGFFWEPESAVHCVNFLPTIFQLPLAQRFFARADWYADLRRGVDLRPDEERWRGHDVYRYEWVRGERRLEVLVDRHSGGLVRVESDEMALEASAGEGRLVVGEAGELGVSVGGARGRSMAVVAEGRDGLSGSLREAAGPGARPHPDPLPEGEGTIEWRTLVRAEKAGRGKVVATLLVGGEPFELGPSVEVVEAVSAKLAGTPSLTPGVPTTVWLTLESALEGPTTGRLRLRPESGLTVEPAELSFDLAARGKQSWQLRLRADAVGGYRLRARTEIDGMEKAVEALDVGLRCGRPGDLAVEEEGERLTVVTDRLRVEVGPHPQWRLPVVQLLDRHTGEELAGHACSFGPPFWPLDRPASWHKRVERDADGVTVTLSASHGERPDLLVERIVRVAASGLVELRYRVTNAGDDDAPAGVDSFTALGGWTGGPLTRAAVPLATGLVVDETLGRPGGFPDWMDAVATDARRLGETWYARFDEGRVVATLWSGGRDFSVGWDQPGLFFDFGSIAAGGTVETRPLYLYAGPGNWRAARALWRQLIAPEAEPDDPTPVPATRARLSQIVGVEGELAADLIVESDRARPMNGRVTLLVDGREAGGGSMEAVRFDSPASVPVRVGLPGAVGARAARVIVDHERARVAFDTALIRAGVNGGEVRVETDGDRLHVDNGRMRLTLTPGQLARVVALETTDAEGRTTNQLHAPTGDPIAFGGRFPWFGGIHPTLIVGDPIDYPGRLAEASFEARPVERRGRSLTWRGAGCATTAMPPKLAGLALEVAYLTLPGSNLLAVELRLENRSGAYVDGRLRLDTFVAPGGRYDDAVLHMERDGVPSERKRAPGDATIEVGDWCAVAAGPGSPVVAMVGGTPSARVIARDLGLEGAHPRASIPARLPPEGSVAALVYLVVAEDVAQARLYRALAGVGGLA